LPNDTSSIAAFAAVLDYRAFGFEYAELLQKMPDLVQALVNVLSARVGGYPICD
jgi:hypothetical protein